MNQWTRKQIMKGLKKKVPNIDFIKKSENMGLFSKEDVIVKDFRILEYGNVIFNHGMEKNRKIVLNFLKNNNIESIGRFGKWGYLWSDQSLLSGIPND